MDLKRIQCVHARAEEFARQHREKFDIATSRAVAQLNILCELALPLVKVGGQFLAMKSVDSDQEVQSAKSAIAQLGGKIGKIWDYTIPGTDIRHRVVIIQKQHPTPAAYPRPFARIKKRRWAEPHLYTRYLDMGKIIAVVSGKGGTGKTSFTRQRGVGSGRPGKEHSVPGL